MDLEQTIEIIVTLATRAIYYIESNEMVTKNTLIDKMEEWSDNFFGRLEAYENSEEFFNKMNEIDKITEFVLSCLYNKYQIVELDSMV